MTVRYVCSVMTATVLTGAVAQVAPLHAQTSGASVFPPPDESALVTVVGCLQLGGPHQDRYVLSNVAIGPATSVPEATCTASGAGAIEVEHDRRLGMNDTMLGRWIEISGRLEKETSGTPEHLRELHARSFRMVPVVPRRAQAAATAPAEVAPPEQLPLIAAQTPAAEPEPAPEASVGTSFVVEERLPKTAGELPFVAVIALLSLAGALSLRWYRA